MGYRLGYSGPEVDVLLQKAYKYSVINNGWAKLDSSNSNPVDLNSLVTQGNYSISFWNNGPVQLNTSGPINVCVTKDSSNGKTYQTIYDAGKVYLRETTGTSFSNTWIEEQNNTDLDINASVPQNPQDNYVWIDTSGEEPTIKVYKESTHSWVPISAADLAKASVYDTNGIKQPIDVYLDQKIADADLSKAEEDYNTHLTATEVSDNINWTEGTISSTSRHWSSVCYGNSKFVTIAHNSNYFAYSTDGINWTETTSGISRRWWCSVCYGNGKFVAVADGSNYFAYSTDGINWTEGTISSTSRSWQSVCYGNGKFVAVANKGYFAYSTDGITWTEGTISDISRNWWSVCYGNGKFVAVTGYSNYFAYSTDGINWTEGTISSTSRAWSSVCYGNGKFVAVADGSNYFAYSTNGITWIESTISDTSRSWQSVCYGNGKFVVVENGSNYFTYASTSFPIHVTTEEKAKWNAGISKDDASTIIDALKTEMTSYANEKINTSTQEVSNISDNVNRISSNIDAHIADSSIHLTAEDVTNFDNKAAGNHKHLNDGHVTVSTANITGLIAVERLDPSVLERNYTVTSYEEMMALTKNEIQNGDSVFLNGTKQSAWFVVDDTKLGEEDYNSKESTISNTNRDWESVCYGNGKFVAVAYNSNYFAYSTDGITWSEGTISDTSRQWRSVCYGNGKFVAVGGGTKYFAYSTDGINWTESMISSTNRNWFSVCYGNGKFVAVVYSYSNTFAYSTDGITWTESTISDTNRDWFSVCYGNGKFVAVAIYTNYFAYSTDGINWTESTISSTSRQWRSVCYGNGKFVAVAFNTNYFAYSTDGINWTEGTISSTSRKWMSVCYGNGNFVAVVAQNSRYFAYSIDGITWTEGTISGTSRAWDSVCYGNGKFVAVASDDNSSYSAEITFVPAGLIQYAAPAKELTWENITNKPSTLAEYNITTSYTKDEINTIYNNILNSINEVKNKADECNAAIPTEIPSDLDETIATNTTSANDLNSKVDILIRNTSLNEAFKNQLLSLVQNKVVGDMNVTMTRTINITSSWDVDNNGPGLSSTFKIPTGTSYTIDLNDPIEDTYTVDETYTSGMTDEHGDTGYYEFSGWSY